MTISSVYSKTSRFVHGGATEVGELGVEWWERRNIKPDQSDNVFTVDEFHKNRLDLISNIFYGEPRYWWIIAQVNNILDPQFEVIPGRILFIPTKDRLMILLNGRVGGFNSEREKDLTIISPVIV